MRTVVFIFAISTVYAVIRYAAFTPEYYGMPTFIVNKGVSMAAALCFAIGFLQHLRRSRGRINAADPAIFFRAGVFGAIAHIPMSLAILRPEYFKEFFIDNLMTFTGELVFLFGGLTAGGLYLLTRTHWTASTRWWLSLATIGTLASHVICMGICRGLNINKSHAYLPPMWLLSLIGIGLGLWWLVRSRTAKPMDDASTQRAPWVRDGR